METINDNESKLKFQKKSRTAGDGGQQYEIHLLMCYLLQCETKKRNNAIKSFRLMSNVDGVGKFAHVVLEITQHDDTSKVLFIQARHKESKDKLALKIDTLFDLKSPDFGLIHSLDGYFKFKSTYNPSHCLRFNSPWDSNDFILYTNSVLIPTDNSKVITKTMLAESDISYFGKNAHYYTLNPVAYEDHEKKKQFYMGAENVIINSLAEELIRCHVDETPVTLGYVKMFYQLLVNDVLDINQEKSNYYFKGSFLEGMNNTKDNLPFQPFKTKLLALLLQDRRYKRFQIKNNEESEKNKERNEKFKAALKEIEFSFSNFDHQLVESFEQWPSQDNIGDKINKFLAHIKIYDDKANNDGLVEEIKERLEKIYTIKGQQNVELYFSYMFLKVNNWWKNDNTIIDGSVSYFEDPHQIIFTRKLLIMSRLFVDNILQLDLEFADVKKLKSDIEKNRIIHLVIDKKFYSDLGVLKVYQALKTIDRYQIDEMKNCRQCFFNDLRSILVLENEIPVIENFVQEDFDVFILQCEKIKTNAVYWKFCESLIGLINEKHEDESKKIIFISSKNDATVQQFYDVFKNVTVMEEKNYKLTDFDDKSQEKFLTKTIVNFQGNDVTFKQLLGRTKSLRQYVDGHLLTNSFVHRKIYLNNKMVGKLNSNISTGKLKKLNEKNEEVDDVKEVKTLEDIIDRIVIISDVCGAGKTTFLDSIIQNTMDANHLHWIVKIDLNDCSFPQSETLRFPEENRNNATIDFLLDSLQLETSLEEEMLRHRIENEGNVSVLFDGFDRICPQYKYIAIHLFQNLKNTKIDRLWIVSRPQMVEELHEKLHPSTVYALERLSKDEQRELIFKIWNEKNNDQSINIDKQKYFEKLDKFLEALLNDSELKFTGIPLYTKILANFYEERFLKWKSNQSNSDLLPNDLDLIDLYQHFIDATFQFYFKKQNLRDAQTKDNEIVQQQSLHDHQLLALDAQFFNKSLFCDIHSNDHSGSKLITELKENKSNVKVGQQQVGLVVKIITTSAESKPLFIHATIADYLAASWFVNNYKKYDWSKNILRNTQFDSTHVNFRKFYDLLLVKNYNGNIGVQNEFSGQQTVENYLQAIEKASQDKNLHELKRLVLSHNNSEIESLRRQIEDRNWDELKRNATLNESKENVDEAIKNKNLDRLREIGRTFIEYKLLEYRLLQTAVEERNLDRVKHLIRQGVDVNAAETTKWTALTKAVERRAYYIVDHLVKRVRDITAADGFSWTPLHRAIDRQDLGLVKLLLDNGADVNERNGQDTKWTAVERAINISSVPITKFLIDNGAKVKTDRDRCPLLLRAIQKVNYELVKILIDAGAEVDIKIPSGHKLLFYAQQKGGDGRIIQLLFNKLNN